MGWRTTDAAVETPVRASVPTMFLTVMSVLHVSGLIQG